MCSNHTEGILCKRQRGRVDKGDTLLKYFPQGSKVRILPLSFVIMNIVCKAYPLNDIQFDPKFLVLWFRHSQQLGGDITVGRDRYAMFGSYSSFGSRFAWIRIQARSNVFMYADRRLTNALIDSTTCLYLASSSDSIYSKNIWVLIRRPLVFLNSILE